MVFGYARVSKGDDHEPRAQVAALRAAGVTQPCTEQASGGRWDRPELHRVSAFEN